MFGIIGRPIETFLIRTIGKMGGKGNRPAKTGGARANTAWLGDV
jgi:hypothetical protein